MKLKKSIAAGIVGLSSMACGPILQNKADAANSWSEIKTLDKQLAKNPSDEEAMSDMNTEVAEFKTHESKRYMRNGKEGLITEAEKMRNDRQKAFDKATKDKGDADTLALALALWEDIKLNPKSELVESKVAELRTFDKVLRDAGKQSILDEANKIAEVAKSEKAARLAEAAKKPSTPPPPVQMVQSPWQGPNYNVLQAPTHGEPNASILMNFNTTTPVASADNAVGLSELCSFVQHNKNIARIELRGFEDPETYTGNTMLSLNRAKKIESHLREQCDLPRSVQVETYGEGASSPLESNEASRRVETFVYVWETEPADTTTASNR